MANPRNIGSGKRHIRFTVQLRENEDSVVTPIIDVARNFDRSVRAEMLNWAADEIVKHGREIIQFHKDEANTPDDNPKSFDLENSFRVEYDQGQERDRMVVIAGVNRAGQQIPYARMHAQPLGSTTTIVPVVANRLAFYWYRIEEFVTFRSVERPGIGFFDRAVEQTMGAGNSRWRKQLKKTIALLIRMGYDRLDPDTGAKLRGRSKKLNARLRRDQVLNQ